MSKKKNKSPRLMKLDLDDFRHVVAVPVQPEQEYCKDHHFDNPALNQLFFLRFLKAGIEPTLENLVGYLSSKNIRVREVKNSNGGSFLTVEGFSFAPLQSYEIKNENEFFDVKADMTILFESICAYNSLIQFASEIGGKKTTAARALKTIIPSKVRLYTEMRPDRIIEVNEKKFTEDYLFLMLLYANMKEFYAPFNIAKPEIQRQLFERGINEQRSGRFRGILAYDRTIQENFRFIDFAVEQKHMSKDDAVICRAINNHVLLRLASSDSIVFRLLNTPEACQALIYGSRGRTEEVGKSVPVDDDFDNALYQAKLRLLKKYIEPYAGLIQSLQVSEPKDVHLRYPLAHVRVPEITPMPVSLEYSQGLQRSYIAGFDEDFVKTNHSGIIVVCDTEQWKRTNDDAQLMKLLDTAGLGLVLLHMCRGASLQYNQDTRALSLPYLEKDTRLVIMTR